MSSYRGHVTFNLVLLPLAVGADYFFFHSPPPLLLTFALSYLYATLYLNPDLDLAYQIKLFSIRGLLSLPFRPYARLFRHRGLSHVPFVGTLTRLIYLALVAGAVFFGVYRYLPFQSVHQMWTIYSLYILYGAAGIVAADLCHLVLDLKW